MTQTKGLGLDVCNYRSEQHSSRAICPDTSLASSPLMLGETSGANIIIFPIFINEVTEAEGLWVTRPRPLG